VGGDSIATYRLRALKISHKTIKAKIPTNGSTIHGFRCTVIGATIAKAIAANRPLPEAFFDAWSNFIGFVFIRVSALRVETCDKADKKKSEIYFCMWI
jgi:hypothetical protein